MMDDIAVRRPSPLAGCGSAEGARGQNLQPQPATDSNGDNGPRDFGRGTVPIGSNGRDGLVPPSQRGKRWSQHRWKRDKRAADEPETAPFQRSKRSAIASVSFLLNRPRSGPSELAVHSRWRGVGVFLQLPSWTPRNSDGCGLLSPAHT